MRAVVARTLAAEWRRLWIVMATWWFLAAAAGIMHLIAVAPGVSAAGQPDPPQGDPAWGVAPIVVLPAQFALLALALMPVTADHATGGIVPTLQWTPRRGVLFLARVTVAAGTATGLGVLLALTSSLAGHAAAPSVLALPPGRGRRHALHDRLRPRRGDPARGRSRLPAPQHGRHPGQSSRCSSGPRPRSCWAGCGWCAVT